MAEIIQIDNNTWRIEDGFVRFFLLEGEDKAVLIDSGISCPNVLEMIKELTTKSVILLNTHGDGDHTSGTGCFDEIYMHSDDYTGCDIARKYPATSLVKVSDGDVIELGNRSLKIVHIPGHTAGSIAILDANKRVLYAGDSVQKGHIYMFGEHRRPEQFEASLDKLIALENEYDCIYASHDEPCLPGDYAVKVKNAWRLVKAGEVAGEEVDLFGRKVNSFTTDSCGFFL